MARLRSGLTVFPPSDRTVLKVLKKEGSKVTVGGPLVVFDEPGSTKRDLAGEYFTADTYFGGALAKGDEVLIEATYNHGYVKDAELEPLVEHEFEPLAVKRTDTALMAEIILDEADAYEKMLAGIAKKGKLGWSSGSATHRVKVSSDGQIERWPLVEGALTPTPCEPRAKAQALKSLSLDAFAKTFLTEAELRAAQAKAAGADESYEAFMDRVRRAVYAGLGDNAWPVETYADRVIVHARLSQVDEYAFYEVPFDLDDDGDVVLAPSADWTRVERVVAYEPVKAALDVNQLFREAPPPSVALDLAGINRLFS